jgi:MFS family permease
VLLVAFVVLNGQAKVPLIEFRLFRSGNFLASVISQVLAGMIELGLGFLLPYYLLLVVGVGPIAAGVALIPGTLPIILAGPLAGRLFDRVGGRWPLTIGFAVLALSSIALTVGVTGHSAWALIPGLVLQGIALGTVLTVNDPVGMNAVEEKDQGVAAGIINTAEQFGGAIGIAILGAVQIGTYFTFLDNRLARENIVPTPQQTATVHAFIEQAMERGIRNVQANDPSVARVYQDLIDAHGESFRVAFAVSAVIAVLGAVASWILVRKDTRVIGRPTFGRRSRWVVAGTGTATAGRSPDAVEPEPGGRQTRA